MATIRQHLAGHRWHVLGCAFAVVLVLGGIAAGVSALAVVGGLMCVAMMAGMIWMMVSMSKQR